MLFLHPLDKGQGIADLYRRAFAEAAELHVLSAYLSAWDTTLKLNERCGLFTFIVGKDFGITRKQACRDVLNWLPEHRKPFFFVADDIAGFHPKALFWRTRRGKAYALIGSSNLSEAGWHRNYEANLYGELTGRQFDEVKTWINEIIGRSVPMSKEWLDGYQEAKAGRKPRSRMSAVGTVSPSAIELPGARGRAADLRERRMKRKLFAGLRPKLLAAIRRCAAGSMSNRAFFDRLEETWGSHPSRVQGWGWQVTGRNSNFQALCRGLLSILDAERTARDLTVVRVIDELRKKGVPTRRALLSELLCLFFPADYPVLNNPVAAYVRPYVKPPHGSSEGAKYLHLALCLRAALRNNPYYPAKDLLELDALIWRHQEEKE